jgi:hypothetical protein
MRGGDRLIGERETSERRSTSIEGRRRHDALAVSIFEKLNV